MPLIVMKTGEHRNIDAIDNVIHYIFSSSFYTYGGTNRVFGLNEQDIIDSFKLVQGHYNKTDGKKIQHTIIGFDKFEGIGIGMAYNIAINAAEYIGNRFQCCYAVHSGSHDKPNYIHIHLAINTISWFDGNRYYENNQNLYDLAGHLNSSTNRMYYWGLEKDPSSSWEI